MVASLKAAIVDGGEIILELFLITKAQVSDKSNNNNNNNNNNNDTNTNTTAPPVPTSSSSSSTATATQFVRITRSYRFTYVDSNKNIPRGFAKNPIENLLSGAIIYIQHMMIMIIYE